MSVRDLIPWSRNSEPTPTFNLERHPFLALHRDMNRLFDDAFRNLGAPSPFRGGAAWPSIELSETDGELRVSAELPGLEEKDVEVTLENGVLSIRGEKKAETKDDERQFTERYYGSFLRQVPIRWEVDADAVKAGFRNGVLSITVPKSDSARQQTRRIPINGG
jgi:HSP20 family protein